MRTDWRNTLTPDFTYDSSGSTCDPIPWPTSQDQLDEFTDTGVLIPYKEFLNYDGFELVESLGDSMEDRVATEIFRRDGSDSLIHLVVLGVPAWILCRTRSAYLRFVRDWIGPAHRIESRRYGSRFQRRYGGFPDGGRPCFERRLP